LESVSECDERSSDELWGNHKDEGGSEPEDSLTTRKRRHEGAGDSSKSSASELVVQLKRVCRDECGADTATMTPKTKKSAALIPANNSTPAGAPMTSAIIDVATWIPNPHECCALRRCLDWYNACVFPNDVMEKFKEDTLLASQITTRYRKMIAQAGTLRNGKVFVAVSDVASYPILGLFSGTFIPKGDVVTTYGGSLRASHEVQAEPVAHHSHTRVIPGSLFVRDGRPYSLLYDRSGIDEWEEYRKPIAERTRLQPKHHNQDILSCVLDGGVGYMTNTGPKSVHNVKIVEVDQRKDRIGSAVLFLVATRDIQPNEEIFSPYNNLDPLEGSKWE